MDKILILPLLLGFFATLFSLPFWIKGAKRVGLIGEDIHKRDKKNAAEAGGIIVLLGFTLGTLSYIAIKTFVLETDITTIQIFALLSTTLIAGIIGFVDDLLGWKIGLTKIPRIILLFFAAIPLMVINAGDSTVLGVEFGLLYPLLLIPIGIIGATTTFNFLEGYNGLGTSQGILILSALALTTYLNSMAWLSLICLIMVACLIAFYIFNKYPASVFPGDVMTYSIGALIAVIAILGNIEKIAIFFFIPYIIETGLKIRGRLKKESFAKLNNKGGLEMPYEKFYGLEHIAIYLLKKLKKGKEVKENEVVWLINLFQILVIGVGFLLFSGGLGL